MTLAPSQAHRPVRALVVDDSRLMRRMIAAALEAEGGIQVVGEAGEVQEARAKIKQLDPDVVTLDVEMPGMSGIDFLRKIMELRPMPVIMVSTLTAAGTDTTIEALQIGAIDAIPKPAGREAVQEFGRTLREKVIMASRARVRLQARAAPRAPMPATARRPMDWRGGRAPDLIAIGASTGGVSALTQLLEGLPPTTPPIVITQHMPPGFTERFANRLNSLLPHDVAEAKTPEPLLPGQIRVAPGDRHLCVVRQGLQLCTSFDDSGPISGHRPSVDVLFNSVSTAVGAGALGVILTGMGRDGAAGLRAMRKAGAHAIGQSEESCVVYGMPQAAKELGATAEELDLTQISRRICEFLNPASAKTSA